MKTIFPKTVLTQIRGQPVFQLISKLFQETCENTVTVDTDLGGGQYGSTGVLLPPDLYQEMLNTPMVVLPNPRLVTNIINLDNTQAYHATIMHKIILNEF